MDGHAVTFMVHALTHIDVYSLTHARTHAHTQVAKYTAYVEKSRRSLKMAEIQGRNM
jgi:hypothetical protein